MTGRTSRRSTVYVECRYEEADDRINNTIKYEQEQRKKLCREEFLNYLQKKRTFFKCHFETYEKIRGFKEAGSRTAELVVEEKFLPLEPGRKM